MLYRLLRNLPGLSSVLRGAVSFKCRPKRCENEVSFERFVYHQVWVKLFKERTDDPGISAEG